jgi:hypothetical protein
MKELKGRLPHDSLPVTKVNRRWGRVKQAGKRVCLICLIHLPSAELIFGQFQEIRIQRSFSRFQVDLDCDVFQLNCPSSILFELQTSGVPKKFQSGLVVVATGFVYDSINSTKPTEDMIYPILETNGVAWMESIYLSHSPFWMRNSKIYFHGR